MKTPTTAAMMMTSEMMNPKFMSLILDWVLEHFDQLHLIRVIGE